MAGHLWWILVSKTLLVLFTAREAETREDSTLNNSIKKPEVAAASMEHLYFFFFKV